MLKKEYRLKRRQDFRQVYQRGQALRNRAFVLCFRPLRQRKFSSNSSGPSRLRLGFSVSKRLGGAVQRNQVRRRLQEACRLELAAFPAGYDYVLVAREAAKGESVASLRQKICRLLPQITDNRQKKQQPRPNKKAKSGGDLCQSAVKQ